MVHSKENSRVKSSEETIHNKLIGSGKLPKECEVQYPWATGTYYLTSE